jgi:inner membrane protein
MSPITHFLMGWGVANSDTSLSKPERALVTWASVIPDVDGFGIFAEILTKNSAHPLHWWSDYHHILAHNLGFAVLVSVVAAMWAEQKLKTATLVFLSFHLHLLADLMGARGPDGDQWPIPYFLPFFRGLNLTWSHQWALNAWPNIVITFGLIATALWLARRRGFSFLEIFSKQADGVLVNALRTRFPLRQARLT